MGIEFVKDEADKKQFDGTALKDKDPSKHYRWSHQREMAIARNQFHGYEVVDSKSDKARSICGDSTKMKKPDDPDTAIRLGDMVLMSTSRENHERRMKEEEARTAAQTKGVSAAYRRAVAQIAGSNLGYEDHRDTRGGKESSYNERDFERDQAREEERKRR